MRTVKELKEFLQGKPDDAEIKISHQEDIGQCESISGFTYSEERVDSEDETDIIETKVVILSSYFHF